MDQIEKLRENVRKLSPNGEKGFEGLVASVLAHLTKRTFALASSGSQRGKDGQSALSPDNIVFEAKRYDESPPKDTVYTKLFEVHAEGSLIDLYILAATAPISAQITATLQEGARKIALPLLILPWPATELPELAIFLAMCAERTAKFIAQHGAVDEAEIAEQLQAVRSHPQFESRSEFLLSIISQPSTSPAFARKDNAAWLREAFSNKRRARSVFGQALSPGDTSMACVIDRPVLRHQIAQQMFAKPDGAVTALIGSDGNGKSWVFAQAWAHRADPPLTVVIAPGDLTGETSSEYCVELLIAKLIAQTNDTRTAEVTDRWRKYFKRWRDSSRIETPRLLVYLDGINQRETILWSNLIDSMNGLLAEIGGKLVLSCRRVFYRDYIENKLIDRVVTIEVPEWSETELDSLLQLRGASISELNDQVVRSLRNPRIFGIAAELFSNGEISAFGELSVNRLLFVHLHSDTVANGATVSSRQFAADICDRAEKIVRRMQSEQRDGVTEFDMPSLNVAERFVVTAAGRFFETLDENPNKYILKEEGLPLALGLALLRVLREAINKQKNLQEALARILDPISALDRTSDVLMAAILAAVLEGNATKVVSPLVRSFVALQNIDAAGYAEFRNLFARSPESFLLAMEDAILTRDVVPNISWLMSSLDDLRGRELVEQSLRGSIVRWLRMYSREPEGLRAQGGTEAHDPPMKHWWDERKAKKEERVSSLTMYERGLLGRLQCEDRGNLGELHELAFRSLAGQPLASHAESLLDWCFGAALDGGSRSSRSFFDLLHFNVIDWTATKVALHQVAQALRENETSDTGKWTLVSVLRGSGDSQDALEAARIVEKLRPGMANGWHDVEQYCDVDPCDPAAENPTNIENATRACECIDPSGLRRAHTLTSQDVLFDKVLPALARFRPEIAVQAMHGLGVQALTRPFIEFRQAVFSLAANTAALPQSVAVAYVPKAHEVAQSTLDAGLDKNNEGWAAAQYALLVAFPHMTGDEQFEALISHPKDSSLVVDLMNLMQPIEASKLENALIRSVTDGDTCTQFRILCFAEHSNTHLTDKVKVELLSLSSSPDHLVRLSALSLIRATQDPLLCAGVVKAGWSAAALDPISAKVEIRYGSEVLVEAAKQGAISIEECLDRIDLGTYGSLVTHLGEEGARSVAARLTIAIRKASDAPIMDRLPDIELNLEAERWPASQKISDERSADEDPYERLERLNEPSDAWLERQRRNREAAERYERELTSTGAQLILRAVTLELIENVDKSTPATIDAWHGMFDPAPVSRTPG